MEVFHYILLGVNLYRVQIRVALEPIFGTNRFRKEYDDALDVLREDGNWFYLYSCLDGSNGEQVCTALNKWIGAYQSKKEYAIRALSSNWNQETLDKLISNERQTRKDFHVLIYGEFTDTHVYASDEYDSMDIKKTGLMVTMASSENIFYS